MNSSSISSVGSLFILTALGGCASTQLPLADAQSDPSFIVAYEDIEWGALNPARGDSSPRAGTLWGDRTKDGASGFLVRFVDGFSSPPHIHNITYRGVVIEGLVHNDDPDAEQMWLPSGSFWTQPAGHVHITSAQGASNLAYIEIDEGPYLVQPTADAFDADDISINVDESNLVWLDASSMSWIEASGSGSGKDSAMIAMLWGDPQDDEPSGSMIKLPAGFHGEIRSDANHFRAVVIQGTIEISDRTLGSGSSFGSDNNANHRMLVPSTREALVYVRSDAPLRIIQQ
jgi:hypothetical protein